MFYLTPFFKEQQQFTYIFHSDLLQRDENHINLLQVNYKKKHMQNTCVIYWVFLFVVGGVVLFCFGRFVSPTSVVVSVEARFLQKTSELNQAHTYSQNSVTVKVLPHYKGPSRCQSSGTQSTRGSIWHFGKLHWQMVYICFSCYCFYCHNLRSFS